MKLFQCVECGKAFGSTTLLQRHVKVTHSGEKPHKCQYCDKSYARHDNLQRHIRSHTREKVYYCDHCEKTYTRHDNLQRHLRQHGAPLPTNVATLQGTSHENSSTPLRSNQQNTPGASKVEDTLISRAQRSTHSTNTLPNTSTSLSRLASNLVAPCDPVSITTAPNIAQKATAHTPIAQKATAHTLIDQKATAHTPIAQKATAHTLIAQKATAHTPIAQKATAHTPIAQKATAHTPIAQKATAHTPIAQKATVHTPIAQKATVHTLVKASGLAHQTPPLPPTTNTSPLQGLVPSQVPAIPLRHTPISRAQATRRTYTIKPLTTLTSSTSKTANKTTARQPTTSNKPTTRLPTTSNKPTTRLPSTPSILKGLTGKRNTTPRPPPTSIFPQALSHAPSPQQLVCQTQLLLDLATALTTGLIRKDSGEAILNTSRGSEGSKPGNSKPQPTN